MPDAYQVPQVQSTACISATLGPQLDPFIDKVK